MMAVVVNEQQADEIIAQYRAEDPEFWRELERKQRFWVMLRDENLPDPEEISTKEMIDLANENLMRLRKFCRKIQVFGDVTPGDEPAGNVFDTCEFIKRRMEHLLRTEIVKELKSDC
jgi:hypothetical protein